jgi:hypothetical protein
MPGNISGNLCLREQEKGETVLYVKRRNSSVRQASEYFVRNSQSSTFILLQEVDQRPNRNRIILITIRASDDTLLAANKMVNGKQMILCWQPMSMQADDTLLAAHVDGSSSGTNINQNPS